MFDTSGGDLATLKLRLWLVLREKGIPINAMLYWVPKGELAFDAMHHNDVSELLVPAGNMPADSMDVVWGNLEVADDGDFDLDEPSGFFRDDKFDMVSMSRVREAPTRFMTVLQRRDTVVDATAERLPVGTYLLQLPSVAGKQDKVLLPASLMGVSFPGQAYVVTEDTRVRRVPWHEVADMEVPGVRLWGKVGQAVVPTADDLMLYVRMHPLDEGFRNVRWARAT